MKISFLTFQKLNTANMTNDLFDWIHVCKLVFYVITYWNIWILSAASMKTISCRHWEIEYLSEKFFRQMHLFNYNLIKLVGIKMSPMTLLRCSNFNISWILGTETLITKFAPRTMHKILFFNKNSCKTETAN